MKAIFSAIHSAVRATTHSAVRIWRGISADSFEVQYLRLVQDILKNGNWQSNRTGVDAISLHGAFIRCDVSKGFPALTTKKLYAKAVFGELCGFLRAATSAADFRELGCKVWDQNANETASWLANPFRAGEDALGPVYGAMWRKWPAYKSIDIDSAAGAVQEAAAIASGFSRVAVIEDMDEGGKTRRAIMFKTVDQLGECLAKLVDSPTDRRILFHGWNPAVIDEIALPACHILYIFSVNVEKKELSLSLTMRSTDVGLGLPFNAASAATLMELMGRLSGLKPKWLSISMADAHIYESHLSMVSEQLSRFPMRPPTLKLSPRIPSSESDQANRTKWLSLVEPADFSLEGYKSHSPIKAPMAA